MDCASWGEEYLWTISPQLRSITHLSLVQMCVLMCDYFHGCLQHWKIWDLDARGFHNVSWCGGLAYSTYIHTVRVCICT